MSTAYIYTPNTVDIYFTYKTDVILNTHSICYQEKQKQLKLHFWLRSNWFCFPSIRYYRWMSLPIDSIYSRSFN